MPDENNLELVIKTTADLAGAQAAETQLQTDIAQANALGAAYAECEARLKSLRVVMAEHQANTGPDAGQPGAMTSGLLGWIMMGIEAAERATRTVYPTSPSEKKPASATDKNQGGDANSSSTPGTATDPENPDEANARLFSDPAPAAMARSQSGGGLKTPVSRDAESASRVGQEYDLPQTRGEREPESSTEIARATADHAQSLRASAERLSATLEQNTQITISLLNRILGLIDSQNRKLGEVDLKTSELSSQIKSLKNP